eukprot:TRINITY_DN4813_c0_g2_i1.p2 TRINITY_DN4813_c0_g2~~TRINITY_DN4813_c0_g2_i1.p2  ORF type:complete len:415 (+),score=184.68 TRINITY_DN4813_c0_g2_i1:1258-2502(+)
MFNMLSAFTDALASLWNLLVLSFEFLKDSITTTPYQAFFVLTEKVGRKPVWLAFPAFPFYCCVVSSDEDVKHVLSEVHTYKKSKEILDVLNTSFGHSLLNMNSNTEADKEEVWEQKRTIGKLINKDHKFLLQQILDKFVANLEKNMHQPFDMVPYITEFTFSFMLAVVFGKQLRPDDAEEGVLTREEMFKKHVDTLIHETGLVLNIPFYPTKKNEEIAAACNEYIRGHVEETRADRSQHPVDMHRALAIAGYATVTALLGSTIKHLGESKKGVAYQDRIANARDEDEAKRLAVRAIKASGAIVPPAPLHQKQATMDDVLPSGERIRKGQHLIVSLMSAQGGKWDPDAPLPFDSLFGLGPRACTGRMVATHFLTEAVVRLLSTFEFNLDAPPTYAKNSMLFECESLRVTLTKRHA